MSHNLCYILIISVTLVTSHKYAVISMLKSEKCKKFNFSSRNCHFSVKNTECRIRPILEFHYFAENGHFDNGYFREKFSKS